MISHDTRHDTRIQEHRDKTEMSPMKEPGFFAAYCGRHGISAYFLPPRPRLGTAGRASTAATTVFGYLQSKHSLQSSPSWSLIFKICSQYPV